MGTWTPGSGATSGDDTYVGDGTDELVNGLGGNDTLSGAGGADTLDGGSGQDVLTGGAGDDIYVVDNELDQVIELANEGTDTVRTLLPYYVLPNNVENLILTGSSSIGSIQGSGNSLNNTITGTNGWDSLFGGGGDDILYGGGGGDSLDGGSGANQMFGGAGDDWYYIHSAADVIVEAPNEGRDYFTADFGSAFDLAQYANFEGIDYAGLGSVTLTGNNDANWLAGESGDDIIYGLGGDDTLRGDGGDDQLFGGDGDDALLGDIGNDSLDGGAGNDLIRPLFLGGIGNNIISGGSGDDFIQFTNDAQSVLTIDGGADNDTFQVSYGRILAGSTMTNVETFILSGAGVALYEPGFFGGIQNFWADGANLQFNTPMSLDLTLVNMPGSFTIAPPQSPSRTVNAASFNFTGSSGDDVLLMATTANARVTGNGGAGNDLIQSGAADDILSGGDGDDVLHAGAGSDSLRGGAGVDTLDGGDGVDTATYTFESGFITIDLADQAANAGSAAGDTLISIEIIEGTDGVDTIRGDAEANILRGNGNADVLEGRAGADTLDGGDGADSIDGGFGADTITGGAGNDVLLGEGVLFLSQLPNSGADTIDGGAGDDMIFGGAGADTLNGGSGNDTLFQQAGRGGAFGSDAVQISVWDWGFDVMDGGAGGDLAYWDFTNQTSALEFTLGASTSISSFSLNGGFAGSVVNIEAVAIIGSSGDNTLTGNAFSDFLRGGLGTNVLCGLGGADILSTATAGAPTSTTLIGGDGDDTYFLSSAATIVEEVNGGTDFIFLLQAFQTVWDMSLYPAIEGFNYTGATALNVTARAAGSALSSGSGADVLTGLGGDDFLAGRGGDDILSGGDGDDYLSGGDGADQLTGGSGDDAYDISDGLDTIIEAAGGGIDEITLYAGAVTSFALPNYVENLRIVFDAAFAIVGNAEANVIGGYVPFTHGLILDGAGGDDTLEGGNGDDILIGGAGADRLSGFDGVDTASYAAAAAGVSANLFNNALNTGDAFGDIFASIENLTGSSFNDTLRGDGGANVLDGGAGADVLIGGAGDDVYVVDSASDGVSENANEGVDTVRAVISYGLGANLENLTLLDAGGSLSGGGNGLGNVLTGNAFANYLDAGAGNDILYGGGGGDTLAGGAGADVMYGGAGDDVYQVDSNADGVIENASEGNDWVITTISLSLPIHVEGMILAEAGGAINAGGSAGDNYIQGNSYNNAMDGGAGADTLAGGAGNDTMFGGGADNLIGGTGDDLYIVDSQGANVTELANEGADAIFTSVSYNMQANVEQMVLQEAGGAINAGGNAGDNYIVGNSYNNAMDGGAGADTLIGGGGNDTMFGGGADNLIGGTGDDLYVVDHQGAYVTEAVGEGHDTIFSFVSYNMQANVEDMVLQEGGGAINAGGNSGDNYIEGNSYNNAMDGGAGLDTLVGGAGNDTFVFTRGQANGDIITDFNGNGAGLGDQLSFVGYGASGASFTQLDPTHWSINSSDGLVHDILTLANSASIDASDYLFA